MRILVTGGTGFIGRHVAAEALRRGHRVRILTRSSVGPSARGHSDDGVDVVRHDLREPNGLAAALRDIDAVVHCAASLAGDFAAQMADTIGGTRNLLDAMQQAGVNHIVGVSTFAVYDYLRIPSGSLLNEDSLLEEDFSWRDPYIHAKRQQEDLIRSRCDANGWRWTLLRPGLVFGPGRTWFYHLGMRLNARRWVCLAGASLLPLTHVENCAAAIVLALEIEAASGAIMNIVDDELPTRRRYMGELALRTAPRPAISEIPWGLLNSASRVAAATNRTLFRGHAPLPGLLQPANLHARCKPLRYSNERLKRVLGWMPRLRFLEALERSVGGGTAD